MVASSVDWNSVLIYGIPSYIAAIGAAVAAVIGAKNRRSLSTPSGRSIGEQVESSHLTSIANNMLLSVTNGPTKPLDPHTVQGDNTPEPQVPTEKS